MRLTRMTFQVGRTSNEQAVANAREATTRLSRLRVEREEVELYLRQKYGVGAVARDAEAAAGGR